MTYDQYRARMIPIHQHLLDIAKRTGNIAMTGMANGSNTEFVALMNRREALIREALVVDGEYFSQFAAAEFAS